MNISDVKINWDNYKDKDLRDLLFEKQDELRRLYNVPICDLDVPTDQQQLRAMSWNVVEEAAEAIEASHHPEHLGDELADMTAFYIELLIMSGITAEQFKETDPLIYKEYDEKTVEYFQTFITSLALAINTLKNRYWRKTNVKTDQARFRNRLLETVPEFCKFIGSFQLTFKDLMDFYLRKHEVNLFRIRSKY